MMRMEKNLSHTEWHLSPENDLATTLASGLITKQRDRLKHCFRLIGIDRMAPTTKVRIKKEWSRTGLWEWKNEAYFCVNVAEVLSSRLSSLSKFGLF